MPLASAKDGDGSIPNEELATGKVIPRIDLTCPECGHVQSEPLRVVSTQCRACLKHYQVRDGEVVARVFSTARLAKPGAHADDPPAEAKPYAPPTPPRKPVPPPMSWWKHMLLRPEPPRAVRCFDCARGFTAGAEAESTQCPDCGAYVSLRNHEIREAWTRELRTCGDVVLHKEGTIRQSRIQCRNLTVFGKIAAQVDCTGDLVIHAGSRISGPIRCRRLHIVRKARVEFHDTVRADEILIEGEVRGVFDCTGTVTLARRALLQGLVRTAILNVRPGASHVGKVEIIEPAESPHSSLAERG
ncbi:MAG: bactofilin family protein [Luteolibacter sp.]